MEGELNNNNLSNRGHVSQRAEGLVILGGDLKGSDKDGSNGVIPWDTL